MAPASTSIAAASRIASAFDRGAAPSRTSATVSGSIVGPILAPRPRPCKASEPLAGASGNEGFPLAPASGSDACVEKQKGCGARTPHTLERFWRLCLVDRRQVENQVQDRANDGERAVVVVAVPVA